MGPSPRGAAAACALLVGLATPALAQVTADGTTSTQVTINADGSVSVGIAPVVSDGISLNRYDQFNVPKPGVQLDNRSAAARTIVNEVTGTGGTRIEGPLEVVGQRAHVIVANPNGIVIDEGRFVNTGRVALTTGRISTSPTQIAPGIFQQNVVATVTGGTITVEGGGLSGQMDAVDLIAHQLRIDGPIVNESLNEGASLRLAAGQSTTEFSSTVVPGNTGLNWATISGAGAVADGTVLIEITRQGALRANRIGIEVNERGAGVRMAGSGHAGSRGFSLRADGQIVMTGADIRTANGLALQAGGIATGSSTITASGGDIVIGSATGLDATDTRISTPGNMIIRGSDRLSFVDTGLTSLDASIQIDTTGPLIGQGLQAEAFNHMLISADSIDLSGGKARSSLAAQAGSLIMTTLGQTSAGDLLHAGGLLQGGSVTPGLTDRHQTASAGAVTLNIKGDLRNTSTDDLAVIFGAGGDVWVRTMGDLENNRGRILANGDITLTTAGNLRNMVEASALATAPDIRRETRAGERQWWTFWMKRRTETLVSYDFGQLSHPDQPASLTASGAITIRADGGLLNSGGEINANGGDLNITALHVETIGLGDGKVHLRRVCVLVCSFDAAGTVRYLGGQLNAAGDIRIDAQDHVINRAGTVRAIGLLGISAAQVDLHAARVPLLVMRPSGFYNFWSSKGALLFLRDQFGGLVAETGGIDIRSPRPLRNWGGSLTAGQEIALESGQEIVRAPDFRAAGSDQTIGLLANLPLLGR